MSLSIPRLANLSQGLVVLELLTVMELPHPLANLDVLVGRDVLAHLLVILDGQRGAFTLAD